MRAVSVGNMRPMCCHEVEGMFPIPDGRCTDRCFHGRELTGLAPGIRGFPKFPDGLQFEPHNTGDVDCHVRNLVLSSSLRRPHHHDSELLTPQAAVSPPASV